MQAIEQLPAGLILVQLKQFSTAGCPFLYQSSIAANYELHTEVAMDKFPCVTSSQEETPEYTAVKKSNIKRTPE
jgi:hypothetical protein